MGYLKTLVHDTFTYGVMGVISRIIGLLLLPVYTRVFSVYDYGVIDIFTVFTNLIIVTATLRLSTSISRYFSEKERGFTREELCSTLLYFNTCVNIIIFSLLFLLSEKISYLIIGNINAADFVVLSADDWAREQETLYVLQNNNLMKQIAASMASNVKNKGYKPTAEELNEITGI